MKRFRNVDIENFEKSIKSAKINWAILLTFETNIDGTL